MQYDELIAACIKALKEFNPKIEGPNSFIERFLKSVIHQYFYLNFKQVTKETVERMFIKQVFYGVLRYTDFLKIFTESLFVSKPSSTERKDETLFDIFIYLTIFRLNELPLDDFKSLVIVSYIFHYLYFYFYYSFKIALK